MHVFMARSAANLYITQVLQHVLYKNFIVSGGEGVKSSNCIVTGDGREPRRNTGGGEVKKVLKSTGGKRRVLTAEQREVLVVNYMYI